MEQVTGDEAFFMYRKNGILCGLIVLWVDDFLGGGNEEFKKDIMDKIYSHFKCSKREINSFNFTGVKVVRKNHSILISQNDYAETIQTVKIDEGSIDHNEKPLNRKEYKQF